MLPYNADATEAEKHQWCLYQLRVLEKILVQYARAFDKGDIGKAQQVADLMYSYGRSLYADDFEFDLEKLLFQHEIFDNMKDLY